jgi:hypothetical protein
MLAEPTAVPYPHDEGGRRSHPGTRRRSVSILVGAGAGEPSKPWNQEGNMVFHDDSSWPMLRTLALRTRGRWRSLGSCSILARRSESERRRYLIEGFSRSTNAESVKRSNEALDFAGGHELFLQVDELDGGSTFLEEALGGAGGLRVFYSEDLDGHSWRRACIGSTVAARRAGRKPEAKARTVRSRAAAMKVRGSVGLRS